MSTAVASSLLRRTSWLALSLFAQQLAFAAFTLAYPRLMWVSAWVVFVPVAILWVLAFIAPPLFLGWTGFGPYFRVVARQGWLFVFAAAVWIASYALRSARDGTPVSYDQMKAHYERR